MKTLMTFICIFAVILCSVAADMAAKPKMKVADDSFPSGHDTPEAAACDLARAFIKRDVALFTNTCIRLYCNDKASEDYAAFLANTVAEIKAEAVMKVPSPGGPKSIGKVFAARHLSMNGPASYGYACFDFQDVMFVDVGVFLHNGNHVLNRTLVIKDRDGKWYVHPIPSVSPLLSLGLNNEPASARDFSEAYEIQK